MFRHKPLLPLLLLLLLAWTTMAQTPTPDPTATATATATPTPRPTEPPAVLIIQPTPQPTPPPPDGLGEQLGLVWQNNWEALILAVITGLLIGVFGKQAAEKIAGWSGKLFHYLFDNYASLPIIRWFYEKEYRKTLTEKVQNLQGSKVVETPNPIRLDKMYVPSLLTDKLRTQLQQQYADQFRGRKELLERQLKEGKDPWEMMRSFHRFVLLGEPGIGKTTCLYHIAFECAQRRRPEVLDYFPIFVALGKHAGTLTGLDRLEQGLPRILDTEFHFPSADQLIKRLLEKGRCLVLLDGLDEVTNVEDHKRLVELVQAFADRYVRMDEPTGRRNILIVSSRTHGYQKGPQLAGFPKIEVLGLREEAIQRFAHNWFGEGNELANKLWREIKENERFLEMARSPLLLLLIVDHYGRERDLPDLRADLYRYCIRTRIERWNKVRSTHGGIFGETEKQRLLRSLALHIFQQHTQRFMQREALLTWLDDYAQKLPKKSDNEINGDMLLDEVAGTIGLVQEFAIGWYGFSHLTLQEYFAAEAANAMGAEAGAALLGGYLARPAWKEVMLLYCGLADNAEPLLKEIVDQAQEPDADHTLWLLAAECLAEGARISSLTLPQIVTDALIARLRSTVDETPLPSDRIDPDFLESTAKVFVPTLTPGQNSQAVASIKLFAAPWLPDHVTTLLESERPDDWLLAEQLLPQQADDALRRAVQARLATLAGSEKAEKRQAAVAGLGRLGIQGGGSVVVLRAGLADEDPAARAEGALALARLGAIEESTAQALRQMAETDPADAARHAALEALLALRREAEVGMVFVPAGEFLMGSSDQDRQADKDEKPQHKLYLPAYFMDRTPVTNAQFRRFIEASGYANPDYWPEAIAAKRWREGQYVDYDGKPRHQPYLWDNKKWNGDEQPVVGVTWYEALAYARWAGKRLPTEAEWEKAARGDDGRIYPWGNEWAADRANTKVAGPGKTTPVGHYAPAGDSPYGAVDMAGNVWEWCSTRWGHDYPYTPDDGREDLSGGDEVLRVLRGGSYYHGQQSARCAARNWNYPRYWSYYGGFRCCCATSSLPGSDF